MTDSKVVRIMKKLIKEKTPSVFECKGFGGSTLRAFIGYLHSVCNSCSGSSRGLSPTELKAVVRNKFLTTANSHQLHSLLLTL